MEQEFVCCLDRAVHCGARGESGLCMLVSLSCKQASCDYQEPIEKENVEE